MSYIIRSMFLVLIFMSSCGSEEQNIPFQKDSGNSGAQWLIRSWSGVIKISGGNGSLNLTESEIGMVFFPDKTFQLTQLSRPDEQAVQGEYQISGNDILDLKVIRQTSSNSMVQFSSGLRKFKITKSANRLNLKDGNLEFELQQSDEVSETVGNAGEGFLFKAWICQNSASFWRVHFFSDSRYLLKLYTPDEVQPLLIMDNYTMTEVDSGQTIQLNFMRKQRRVTMEYDWQPDSQGLTGVVYSGTLKPASPGNFYCRPN